MPIMVSFTLHFQLHRVKSLIFCYIVSFYNFSSKYFRFQHTSPIKSMLKNVIYLDLIFFTTDLSTVNYYSAIHC